MHALKRPALIPWLGLVLLALIAFSGRIICAEETKGENICVCGHSFHSPMSGIFGEFGKLAGLTDHRIVASQYLGGSRVQQHWDLPDERDQVRKVIKAGEVDVLTLSPVLTIPDDGIDKFTELLIKHSSKGRVTVQVSWYPWDKPGNNNQNFKNEERDQADVDELRKVALPFHDAVAKQIAGLNERLKPQTQRDVVFLVPVGAAVYKLRDQIVAGKAPGISKQSELFIDPIGHAKAPVMVLNAYCHYGVIYRQSPVGLPAPKALGATMEPLNKLLQEIAWEAVQSEPLSGVK